MRLSCRCLTLCLLALPLLGQAAARQGSQADVQQSRFTSPMVIELPVDRLKKPEPGEIYAFTDQDKFVCDDVSLPLVVIRKKLAHSPESVELRIESTVFVRPSFDRKVTLRYTLLQQGNVLATAPDQHVSAKEKKHRMDNSTLVVAKEAFDQLFLGDGGGVLKVLVIVEPDR